MRDLSPMLQDVEKYYSEKLAAFGRSPQGADWNSAESQAMRFAQLLRLLNTDEHFSVNDYGCGYGALVEYMQLHKYTFDYHGYDISRHMISEAESAHARTPHCEFFCEKARLSVADYTVASGIFNVRLGTKDSAWLQYIVEVLNEFKALSRKAFAFNALTKYADAGRMRPDLYYADPFALFDYCKTHFSPYVSLLHDYKLYEFTIVVKLSGSVD